MYVDSRKSSILLIFCRTAQEKSQPKASDILGEFFDSDSEQDISLHSARTPITAFFNKSRTKSFLTSDFEDEGGK